MPLAAEFLGEASEHVVEHDGHHHHHSKGEGVQGLLLGIILHKIPVSIALMTLLLASGFKVSKAWGVLFAFALMAPLGMIVGHYRSEEHTTELQSRPHLVCRLLL